VGELAWNIYKSYKNAPTSFDNLSSEVLSLHAVIKEAGELLSASTFRSTSQGRLDVIMTGSRGVLTDLQLLLDRHQRVGSKARQTSDRLKWHFEDVAAFRLQLISNTSLLSTFIR
jgi:hypothetical protein